MRLSLLLAPSLPLSSRSILVVSSSLFDIVNLVDALTAVYIVLVAGTSASATLSVPSAFSRVISGLPLASFQPPRVTLPAASAGTVYVYLPSVTESPGLISYEKSSSCTHLAYSVTAPVTVSVSKFHASPVKPELLYQPATSYPALVILGSVILLPSATRLVVSAVPLLFLNVTVYLVLVSIVAFVA